MNGQLSRPRAGVAMCVYNGISFLLEQLESITAQTELPARLAVVDDGSSDGSWELVQRWAATAPFEVRLQRNASNVGVVRNFEHAIELLGDDVDLIFLADQDDRWLPEKLAIFVDLFIADPALGLLHSDADLIDDSGEPLGRRLFETLLVTHDERSDVAAGNAWRVYAKRNLVTGAACAFRRSLLTYALPFPSQWIHDEWLAFVASLVSKVGLVAEPTMAYRLHQSNTVGLPIPNWAWRVRTTWQAFMHSTAPRQRLRGERLRQIADVASNFGAHADACQYLEAAATHADFRGNLPRNPFSRFRGVMREWRAGHYRQWSNGEISFLHDLLVAR